MPGFLVLLLQIVASNDVDLATRQAGAISLKNMAKKWRPYEDEDNTADPQQDYPEADRNVVKENIIEALVHAPPAIQYVLLLPLCSFSLN